MKKHTLLVAGVLAGGTLLAGGHALRAGNDSPEQLRAVGPAGLEKFWAMHRSEIETHGSKLRAANFETDANWRLLSEQLDAIAGQQDAWSSHLYWYTDLEAAKAASRAAHKPILSLRMLGKLTDEYSCANSRFFRTALYANAQISQTLRDEYILFWSSERPVPVVTIDMGDGRVVKRSLTGNSAHYLLDSAGRPLDVLPGLYGPGAFQAWLEKGDALFRSCDGLEGAPRSEKLKAWHDAEIVALADKYMEEWTAANLKWAGANQKAVEQYQTNTLKSLRSVYLLEGQAAAPSVPAPLAGRLASSKSGVERPLLDVTVLYQGSRFYSRDQMLGWGGLKPFVDKCRLDEKSRLLLQSQRPVLDANPESTILLQQTIASNVSTGSNPTNAVPAQLPTDPFARLVEDFERNMAVDTSRNEWTFHASIHQWFVTHEVNDFNQLNRLIYDNLFLTPKSDPWLGLSPAGTYTGLTDGGLFNAPKANQQRQANAK